MTTHQHRVKGRGDMIQTRRKRIHTIDAKLYLYPEESYPPLLTELETILNEELSEFEKMPDGQLDGQRGSESRNAQACLGRAIKGLTGSRKKRRRI